MTKATVSSFLSMQNALNTRKQQMQELRGSCTSRTFQQYGENTTKIEPTYDIKQVDAMLTDLNKALFKIDQKIKETNAKTEMEIDIDFDKLMSGI